MIHFTVYMRSTRYTQPLLTVYDAAYMIHCSAAFMTSANISGSFVFEERGTINVKV